MTVKPPPRSLLTPLEIEFAHVYNVSSPCVHVCARVRDSPHLSHGEGWGDAPASRAHSRLVGELLLFLNDRWGNRGSPRCSDSPRVPQQGNVEP